MQNYNLHRGMFAEWTRISHFFFCLRVNLRVSDRLDNMHKKVNTGKKGSKGKFKGRHAISSPAERVDLDCVEH